MLPGDSKGHGATLDRMEAGVRLTVLLGWAEGGTLSTRPLPPGGDTEARRLGCRAGS